MLVALKQAPRPAFDAQFTNVLQNSLEMWQKLVTTVILKSKSRVVSPPPNIIRVQALSSMFLEIISRADVHYLDVFYIQGHAFTRNFLISLNCTPSASNAYPDDVLARVIEGLHELDRLQPLNPKQLLTYVDLFSGLCAVIPLNRQAELHSVFRFYVQKFMQILVMQGPPQMHELQQLLFPYL